MPLFGEVGGEEGEEGEPKPNFLFVPGAVVLVVEEGESMLVPEESLLLTELTRLLLPEEEGNEKAEVAEEEAVGDFAPPPPPPPLRFSNLTFSVLSSVASRCRMAISLGGSLPLLSMRV